MDAQIKESLIKLLAGIKRADGEAIISETRWLDETLASVRADLHPQLVHFLEQRSYVKALMFLGGETDIPVGICGGRAK